MARPKNPSRTNLKADMRTVFPGRLWFHPRLIRNRIRTLSLTHSTFLHEWEPVKRLLDSAAELLELLSLARPRRA